MFTIVSRTKRLIRELRQEISNEIRLDATTQSIVGSIAAMPLGGDGNQRLADLFFALFFKFRPNIFCDIGANRGEIGVRAKGLMPECEVHGFEANPTIHAANEANILAHHIKWHNLAVSSTSGDVDIYVPHTLAKVYKRGRLVDRHQNEPPDTGKSSLLQRDENAQYNVFKVPSVDLDSFFAKELKSNDFFLWIDVEGAASLVLEGAGEVLAKTKAIFVEVEGHKFWRGQTGASGVFSLLLSRGFIPIFRDREYADAQFNALFIHASLLDHISLAALSKVPEAVAVISDVVSAPSSIDYQITEIPVLVPCFNNSTYCQAVLAQLRRVGFRDITFVDNASSSPKMLAWLSQSEGLAKIERLQQNLGPQHSVFSRQRLSKLPRHFCVTDPDMLFNKLLPPNFLQELVLQTETYGMGKAGFALDISNRRLMKQDDFVLGDKPYKIWEWEEQYWSRLLGYTSGGDAIFRAGIDTTFALYDQRHLNLKRFLRGIRIAGRYTAQHAPWFSRNQVPSEEAEVYANTQKYSNFHS